MTLREACAGLIGSSTCRLLAVGPEVEQLELLVVHLAGAALVAFDVVRDTGSHRPLSSPRALELVDDGFLISTVSGALLDETMALAGPWRDVLDVAGTSAPLGFALRGASLSR